MSVGLRVLHFYKTSFPDTMGGAEQVIFQIASGTAAQGIETTILSLTRDRNATPLELEGVSVVRALQDFEFGSNAFSWRSFFAFRKLAARADVIHFHFPWPFGDLVYLLSGIRKPAIVTYHSDIVRQQTLLKIYRPLKRCFLGRVDRIVATSPNYLRSSQVLQKYADKVSVIPIGVDKARYPAFNPSRADYWRECLGAKPFFLFVGVLRYYKGLHLLIEAVRDTDIRVVIVGAGPIEAELKEQAFRWGMSNVHFLGFVSDEDKVALLHLCYGVVFPSHLRSEAFGVSLLEGAMYGKPMISSEIGTGTTFINIADETGLVVPPSDPTALRVAMQTLLNNPERAAEFGKNAESRYWSLFTAEKMVASYRELYEGITRLE